MLSTALGHTCHMVQLMAKYSCVCLRYQPIALASRSGSRESEQASFAGLFSHISRSLFGHTRRASGSRESEKYSFMDLFSDIDGSLSTYLSYFGYARYDAHSYCTILQHTATHCNTLQHTDMHFLYLSNARYVAQSYCNTLQHTATC